MKGRDLLEQVFDHLSVIEKDYFGLCYRAETNKMVGTFEQITHLHLCVSLVSGFLCQICVVS